MQKLEFRDREEHARWKAEIDIIKDLASRNFENKTKQSEKENKKEWKSWLELCYQFRDKWGKDHMAYDIAQAMNNVRKEAFDEEEMTFGDFKFFVPQPHSA